MPKYSETQLEVIGILWNNRPNSVPLGKNAQKVSANKLVRDGLVKKHDHSLTFYYSLSPAGEAAARKLAEDGAFVSRWKITVYRKSAAGDAIKAYSTHVWKPGQDAAVEAEKKSYTRFLPDSVSLDELIITAEIA